jgi:hypothetical protein
MLLKTQHNKVIKPLMSFEINEYYSKLKGDDVILALKGSITSDVINKVLESVEEKLVEAEVDGKIRKKVYNVLVESLQNLFHHTEETPRELIGSDENKFGIISVSKKDNGFLVSTGNFVTSGRIKPLKEKIDKINSLSQDELKDMYKFILNHQKLTAKGGGGLGLVDIARKTGNKLNYAFYEVNNDFYFFKLEIFVS